MALQAAVYALQGASNHSASLFRQALTSLITAAGTVSTGELALSAQSTPNMSIQVAGGRVWLPGTQVSAVSGQGFTTQAAYFALNDAPVTLTVAAADPTNPRADLVYVAVQDAYYSGSNNQPALGIVTGTPAASPQLPTAPANGIGLGYVYVAANATSITSGNVITYSGQNIRLRGGTYLCTSSTRPASPLAGWEIYETDTNRKYAYDGTNWDYLSGGGTNGWQTLTPASPFSAGSSLGLRYQIVNNICYVQIEATGTWSAGATITTLPSGARPSKPWWCTADIYGNTTSPATVNTNGTVTIGGAYSGSGLLLCTAFPLG